MFSTAKLPRVIITWFLCSLLFSRSLKAELSPIDWQTQLYGGEYYEDIQVGAYGIASKHFLDNLAVTGELLYERYSDGERRYTFSGVGAHFLWEAGEFAKFGLVGSHSHDEYDYDKDFQDPNSEYVSNTLGLEGEINHDPLTLAMQVGGVSSDYYSSDYPYLSMDIYYWGAGNKWYARTAIRNSDKYKEYTLEGYRTFFAKGLPLTAYVGITHNNLSTEQEILTYHTQYDSVYAGCNIEFLTTTSSSWNLWFEGAKEESDSHLSVELIITFGPGVDAPYISAFGFTP